MKIFTSTILMVRPAVFYKNEQTAINNYFQQSVSLENEQTTTLAIEEFDFFVKTLRKQGVQVIVAQDSHEPKTPDSVFPNNWVSFHDDGTTILYPMYAPNRRLERSEAILDLIKDNGFEIKKLIDYTTAEEENRYLESTGSMVLDRENRKVYCALSPRADKELVMTFCKEMKYTPILFVAYQTIDNQRLPIYHTNVMMSIGTSWAIVCLDAIDDKKERKNLIQHLDADGKQIIDISREETANFAGNVLELDASSGPICVMSTRAYHSLSDKNKQLIINKNPIVHAPLDFIEICGGGSARCMMAEIFLPKSN